MLTDIHPKLPMRNKNITKNYYINELGFTELVNVDYKEYLILKKDNIEIHFFEFKSLNPKENYGQVYIRLENIEAFYQSLLDNDIAIHPNGLLQNKPWGHRNLHY